jgi:hypothetical protein
VAAGREKAIALLEECDGVGNVLEDMVHRNDVKRPLRELDLIESPDEDLKLAAFAGHLGGLRVHLYSHHAPSEVPHVSEIPPASAADVQKASFVMPRGKEHIESKRRATTQKGDGA